MDIGQKQVENGSCLKFHHPINLFLSSDLLFECVTIIIQFSKFTVSHELGGKIEKNHDDMKSLSVCHSVCLSVYLSLSLSFSLALWLSRSSSNC